ncbi:MAG: hypothetical protein ACREHC_03275 [Candidatus Levyibacteriota bacterium]
MHRLTHQHYARHKKHAFTNIVLVILLFVGIVIPVNFLQSQIHDLRSRASNPMVDVTGKVSFVADLPSKYYLITSDNKIIQLNITGSTLSHNLFPGEQIMVHGRLREKSIDVTTLKSLTPHGTKTQILSNVINQNMVPKSSKTAVILFNFANNPLQIYPKTDVEKAFTSNPDSIKNYYLGVSYGKAVMQGKNNPAIDVFDWITLPTNLPTIPQNGLVCSLDQLKTWSDSARQMLQSSGKNLDGYDKYAYIFPLPHGCNNFGGITSLDSSTTSSWFPLDNTLNFPISSWRYLFLHEFGHTFGLDHAHQYDCHDENNKKVPISNTCDSSSPEAYEPLGIGVGEPNAFHKEKAGWLSAPNITTIDKSGTYTLSPLEEKTDQVQALKIPTGSKDANGNQQYYYVEFRQQLGFDKASNFFVLNNTPLSSNIFNGVTVHLAPVSCASEMVGCDSALINMDPNTKTGQNAALETGNVFTDAAHKISLRTEAISNTKSTVNIQMDGTLLPTPNVTTALYSPTNGVIGTSLSFTILLHGIGAAGDILNPSVASFSNKSPLTQQRDMQVTLYDAAKKQLLAKTIQIKYDSTSGTFLGKLATDSSLQSGAYSAKLQVPGFIPNSTDFTLLGQSITLPSITLTTGDINNDAALNVIDYNALLDCGYGAINPLPMSDPKSPSNNPLCRSHTPTGLVDINDDGVLNSSDYNLFLREMTGVSTKN